MLGNGVRILDWEQGGGFWERAAFSIEKSEKARDFV